MAPSKIKTRKQAKRLEIRIREWENISNDNKYGKSGKPTFTKPGSNRK